MSHSALFENERRPRFVDAGVEFDISFYEHFSVFAVYVFVDASDLGLLKDAARLPPSVES